MLKFRIILRRAFSISRRNESSSQRVEPKPYLAIPEKKNIKKSITMAIVGNSNAGKSTLINTIIGSHICAASKKQHTTLESQRVLYVHGDTQIILLDTPGVLSLKEKVRFNFEDKADVFMIKEIRKADVVGVIVDVSCRYTGYNLGGNLRRFLKTLPNTMEFVLILNKVDLIRDKSLLLKTLDNFFGKSNRHEEEDPVDVNFSRAFLISALHKDGVEAILEYLCSIASETPTARTTSLPSETPKLIKRRIRAALLEYLKEEIPYTSHCSVEFLHENDKGDLYADVTIHCPRTRHERVIRGKRDCVIEMIADKCEKDLEEVFKKRVYLRLETVVKEEKRKPRR